MQLLADLLNKNVATIGMPDVSALGRLCWQGLKWGFMTSIEAFKKLNNDKKNFQPADNAAAIKNHKGWQKEIQNFADSNK